MLGDGMAPRFALEDGLVCPACRGELERIETGWTCRACSLEYARTQGFPDFLLGDRFPDTAALRLLEYEERANAACARDYYVPTLVRLLSPASERRPRVLSVGCGTGVDVEILAGAGFDAVGLDCGHRCEAWTRRACSDRLLLARGERAPFRQGLFDAVIMGCVFPHVGVEGDSFEVRPDFRTQRLELAREIARLLKPEGHLLVSSPNRRFPFDLFHRRDPTRRVPRPNRPRDPFLLSFEDYHELFVEGAGCRAIRPLPISGYWGFVNMGARASTRLLRGLLRGWFDAVSSSSVLRQSALSPWLCIDVVR
ncbi:MAG TPA: class I SAM-dependent methyltransferase [Myxococcota bacterium]|jgi:SAM-dependent methyltransferase